MKIVIATCDKNSWLIPVFLYFYKKYWPDNPYETEIVTEQKHVDGTVFYTKEVSWSTGIINYLNQSKDDKFLLIIEDHLIRKPIITSRVNRAERLCSDDVGCVRLNNAPHKYFNHHSKRSDIKAFREYPLDQRFAMTLQVAIYQKQFLLDVLRDGEDVWKVECNGSARLREMKSKWRILWPKNNIVDVPPTGILRKGRFKPPILRWATAELLDDATINSKKIYKILQKKI